jgi:putative hydrolase of the HAD superfamily
VWETVSRGFTAELGGLTPTALYQAIRGVSDWYWSDPARHRAGRLKLYVTRREIIRLVFERLGRDDWALADKIADAYTAAREREEALAPRAIETLEDLRRRGYRLALITNGSGYIQQAKIEKFKLAPYFDNILIEGVFGCGKPDRRVFLHTMEKLGVSASDAWMVGDDLEFDIAPCNALGIYALWVDGKGDGLPENAAARPDVIIRDISEIPGLL